MRKNKVNFADLQIVEVPIKSLSPPDYYNRLEIEGRKTFLEKAIEKHGLIVPLLVNTSKDRENIIIDGVARWEICKSLGHETIKVLLTSVTKEEEIQQHIISNHLAKGFYKEFIVENIADDLADALLTYYSKGEELQEEDHLKDIQSTSDLSNELTKFNIAIYRCEVEWFDKMKALQGLKNRSQVVQFLIQNYNKNGNHKTA